MDKKRKRKIEIGLSIGVAIVLITLAIVIFVMLTQTSEKEQKASKIFGNDYCEVIMHMATRDLAPHTCEICGVEFQDSSMRANICTECATETNRCDFCGKKLKEK